MKYLFITDLHFGIYKDIGLMQHQFDTLNRIIEEEDGEEGGELDGVIIGGDVFHYKNPRPEVILEVKDWVKNISLPVLILKGNHDTLNKTPNSRHLLEFIQGVGTRIFDKPDIISLNPWDDNPTSVCFIPHYYDAQPIIDYWNNHGCHSNPDFIFGHFAYKGYIAHHDIEHSDLIDLDLFRSCPDAHIFLGHIHEPRDEGRVHVVGTQYSISFGEANQDKRYLVIEDGKFEFKPMKHGIKHIRGSYEEVSQMIKDYQDNFKLLCRVNVRELDSAYVQDIKDTLIQEENVLLVDVRVIPEDVTPNKASIANPSEMITGEVIDEYIEKNPIDEFTPEELKSTYEDILNEAKEISCE